MARENDTHREGAQLLIGRARLLGVLVPADRLRSGAAAGGVEGDECVSGEEDASLLEQEGAVARGVPGRMEHARAAGYVEDVALAERLDRRYARDRAASAGERVEEVAGKPRAPGVGKEPRGRLTVPGSDDVRVRRVRENAGAALAVESRRRAEMVSVRVRQHDCLDLGSAATERGQSGGELFVVARVARVDEGQSAVVLDEVPVHPAATQPIDAVGYPVHDGIVTDVYVRRPDVAAGPWIGFAAEG